MRVRAKICGITRVQDAQLAVELGAEFVGLNFWPGSPRCLSLEDAEPVAEAVRGRATTVGVRSCSSNNSPAIASQQADGWCRINRSAAQ